MTSSDGKSDCAMPDLVVLLSNVQVCECLISLFEATFVAEVCDDVHIAGGRH